MGFRERAQHPFDKDHGVSSLAYELTLWRNQLQGIAEEMGRSLARGAFSPNICERLDFSCALFDREGQLLAQAAHIPVHLGSLPELVQQIAQERQFDGDGWISNSPYHGGTHLPDLTLIFPVFWKTQLVGFSAVRAHHADVGGMSAGSMPNSQEVYQEGLILPPTRLLRRGRLQKEIWQLILANVRTPEERAGDLAAQIAAAQLGRERLRDLWAPQHQDLIEPLFQWGEQPLRQLLAPLGQRQLELSQEVPWNQQLLQLHLRLQLDPQTIQLDWTSSCDALQAPINATRAITCAASYFPFLALSGSHHLNQGSLRPFQIRTRPGSLLEACSPFPVCAGNVETSQWICSLVWRALAQIWPDRVGASPSATMNNLSLGNSLHPFSYYETCGGGHGGHPHKAGSHGQQVAMTNTRNTPAEILELYYPLRLWRYALRADSGGRGQHPGGQGVEREVELLTGASVSLLASHRQFGPQGLAGGEAGSPGRDAWREAQGGWQSLQAPWSGQLPARSRIRLQTPGGGGWGAFS